MNQQIDKDCILVAESFSGPIAAAVDNHNIRGICFVATFLKPPRPFLLSLTQILPEFVLNRPPPDFLLGRYMSDIPEVTEELKEVISSLNPKTVKKRMEILRTLKPAPTMAVPALYLQAVNDRLVSESSVKDFAVYENLTVKKVKGSHLLLQENPADCAAAIKDWLGL